MIVNKMMEMDGVIARAQAHAFDCINLYTVLLRYLAHASITE